MNRICFLLAEKFIHIAIARIPAGIVINYVSPGGFFGHGREKTAQCEWSYQPLAEEEEMLESVLSNPATPGFEGI
jgi:hypothetical protein